MAIAVKEFREQSVLLLLTVGKPEAHRTQARILIFKVNGLLLYGGQEFLRDAQVPQTCSTS